MLRIPIEAARNDGVFLTRDAVAIGHDHDEIAAAVRKHEWHRLRRGAYVENEQWEGADDRGRHLLMARAVNLQMKAPAVLSHSSAAVALDLPLVDVDLDDVHITRVDASARSLAGVVHHAAAFTPADVVEVTGLAVLAPARTALDVARRWGPKAGLVAADHALRTTEGLTPDDLRATVDLMADWPGVRDATHVAALADARAETPIESMGHLVTDALGYETELQVEVLHPSGWVVARVDALIVGEDVMLEYDGAAKYADPQGTGRVLYQEKRREDLLRDLGFEVVRLSWADLLNPAHVDQLIRAAIRRARQRPRSPYGIAAS